MTQNPAFVRHVVRVFDDPTSSTVDSDGCIRILPNQEVALRAPKGTDREIHRCKCDKVYPSNVNQEIIFEENAADCVKSAFNGENVMILACGASGSGKTYTLQGNSSFHYELQDGQGIIPRSIFRLFDLIYNESAVENSSVQVSLSYSEFQDGMFVDLLTCSTEPAAPGDKDRESSRSSPLKSPQEALEIVHNARTTATNVCKKQGPQILTILVERKENNGNGQSQTLTCGRLQLVDLSGFDCNVPTAVSKSKPSDNSSSQSAERSVSIVQGSTITQPGAKYGMHEMIKALLRASSRVLVITNLKAAVEYFQANADYLNFSSFLKGASSTYNLVHNAVSNDTTEQTFPKQPKALKSLAQVEETSEKKDDPKAIDETEVLRKKIAKLALEFNMEKCKSETKFQERTSEQNGNIMEQRYQYSKLKEMHTFRECEFAVLQHELQLGQADAALQRRKLQSAEFENLLLRKQKDTFETKLGELVLLVAEQEKKYNNLLEAHATLKAQSEQQRNEQKTKQHQDTAIAEAEETIKKLTAALEESKTNNRKHERQITRLESELQRSQAALSISENETSSATSKLQSVKANSKELDTALSALNDAKTTIAKLERELSQRTVREDKAKSTQNQKQEKRKRLLDAAQEIDQALSVCEKMTTGQMSSIDRIIDGLGRMKSVEIQEDDSKESNVKACSENQESSRATPRKPIKQFQAISPVASPVHEDVVADLRKKSTISNAEVKVPEKQPLATRNPNTTFNPSTLDSAAKRRRLVNTNIVASFDASPPRAPVDRASNVARVPAPKNLFSQLLAPGAPSLLKIPKLKSR